MPALSPVTHAHPLELQARASRSAAVTEAMEARRIRTTDLSCIVAEDWGGVLVSFRVVWWGVGRAYFCSNFGIGRYCFVGYMECIL